MSDQIAEALNYAFFQRALVAGCFIALSCAFLGIFLVLKRLSLIGDGLAHVGFGTIALALLLHAQPLYVSIPLVMVSSLLVMWLVERAQIFGDAAIGLLASFGIAIGVMFASLAGGFNVDLFGYLFGSILSITPTEVLLSVLISAAVILAAAFLYNDLFSSTFDEEYARTTGVRVKAVNTSLMLLSSLSIIIGIKVVGTLLVSSLIILPAVTALQVSGSFKKAMILSGIFAVASVILGIFLSFIFNLPTGATIVLVNFAFFLPAYVTRLMRR